MKSYFTKMGLCAAFAIAVLSVQAQEGVGSTNEEKKREEKKVLERTKGEDQEILIRLKGSSLDKKKVIVIEDGKVTVDGKPVDSGLKDDVEVLVMKRSALRPSVYNFNMDLNRFSALGNKAVLGVVTETGNGGAKVNEVSKGSGAEKAGIKSGDIITKVGDEVIKNPEDLVKALSTNKPGDQVNVLVKRGNKEEKFKATLGERPNPNEAIREITVQGYPRLRGQAGRVPTPNSGLNFEGIMDWNENFSFSAPNGTVLSAAPAPKMGFSVQDREEGKGAQVTAVDQGSAAEKAGIKLNDIILELDGTPVEDVTDLSRMIARSRTKKVIAMKIDRKGKVVNVEMTVPRKLKTANL
jgi:serine protease Do